MQTSPVRVLVVEDDWFMTMEATKAVRSAGLEVLGPFPCPSEAEKVLDLKPPDAALLDIDVGEGTTLDLARKLRAAGVPVVFHSDWLHSELPSDLAVVPLVPKWKGLATAVATLATRLQP